MESMIQKSGNMILQEIVEALCSASEAKDKISIISDVRDLISLLMGLCLRNVSADDQMYLVSHVLSTSLEIKEQADRQTSVFIQQHNTMQ